MGRVSHYPAGSFSWVELATPRLADDAAFYAALLGWKVEISGDTAIARIDGLTAAGFASEPAGGGWRTSVAVDDPSQVARRATELGGTATNARLIRDPEGAELWLQTAGHDAGAEVVNELGAWSWTELVSGDIDSAAAFYGELFGWSTEDAGAPIARRAFTLSDRLVGGVHLAQAGETAGVWHVSFRVQSAADAAERATGLGGHVITGPMDVPIGAFTVVSDPTGAPLTVSSFAAPFRGVDGS